MDWLVLPHIFCVQRSQPLTSSTRPQGNCTQIHTQVLFWRQELPDQSDAASVGLGTQPNRPCHAACSISLVLYWVWLQKAPASSCDQSDSDLLSRSGQAHGLWFPQRSGAGAAFGFPHSAELRPQHCLFLDRRPSRPTLQTQPAAQIPFLAHGNVHLEL